MSPQQRAQKVRDAYTALQQRPGDWVPLADLREQLGGMSRAEQDETLKELATTSGVQIIPWDNRNALGPRDHEAALRFGGEENHAIRIEAPDDGLDAKRQRLAQLDAEVVNTSDMRASQQARLQADDLRREIGRIERGDDAGKVDQPREVTNTQIVDKIAELVKQTGRPYVSLVRLRAALPHIKHDEVTAALKELDRARVIQLDPDSDQKNVPLEAYEAAVVMGGQRRLLVSLIQGS